MKPTLSGCLIFVVAFIGATTTFARVDPAVNGKTETAIRRGDWYYIKMSESLSESVLGPFKSSMPKTAAVLSSLNYSINIPPVDPAGPVPKTPLLITTFQNGETVIAPSQKQGDKWICTKLLGNGRECDSSVLAMHLPDLSKLMADNPDVGFAIKSISSVKPFFFKAIWVDRPEHLNRK